MKNDIYNSRKYVIGTMIIVTIVIYLIRLFYLQIINYDQYFAVSDNNASLRNTILPTRGLLYDRNKELLVFNKTSYNVMITMKEVKQPFDTLDFCRTIGIEKEQFDKRVADIKNRKLNRGYSPYTPQMLISQLPEKETGALQGKLHRFQGISLREHTLRKYKYPYAAHLIGTIGEVSQTTIDNDSYYALGDLSGQSGVELTYEKELRGEKGFEFILRDSKGRPKGRYEDGAKDIIPKSGENLTLTIDILLQSYGEKLMQGKLGSVVAIEPATGEILAMVSNPTFDPSILVGKGKERTANYQKLENDPTKPLLNRATQARYSPGSTFKPLQTLVCLQENGINNNTFFSCIGQASTPIRCTHSHGSPVSLLNAVEQSCNPYYWQAFRSTLEQDGYGEDNEKFKANYNKWRENVMSFGLGKRLDSDIREQSEGNVPSEQYFNRVFGEKGWRALTIRSLSIGQGEILTTPLQLANMTAVIANRGFYYSPHAVRNQRYSEPIYTNVDTSHFDVVIEGMWRVCEYGTGRWHKIKGTTMCGKTGTVQNNHGKDHSLFIGFAPKDNPQIAIAVVVENSGFGATWANPIASLMMEMYLNREISADRLHVEERMVNANLIQQNAQQQQ